jgi:hypothetical protein
MTTPGRASLGAALVAVLVLLAGCAAEPGRPAAPVRPLPTRPLLQNRADAKARIDALVDETLTAAAPGRARVAGQFDGYEIECVDDDEEFDGTFMDTGARAVRGVDDELAAAAEQRVTALWRRKGLHWERDDRTPGLVDLVTGVDGIELLFSVSRGDHSLLARGQGPCLPP